MPHYTLHLSLSSPIMAPHLRSKVPVGKTPTTTTTANAPASPVASSSLQHANDTPPLSPSAPSSLTMLPPMSPTSDISPSSLKNTVPSYTCLPLKEPSSDLDTDSETAYTQTKPAYIHVSMSSNIAFIEHPVTKHCLILTIGDVSPKALVDLIDAHNKYFIVKDINDADKVKKILGRFKDVHIRDWITSDREHLLALDYEAFIAELHANYLPANWEDNVCMQILSIKMEKNNKFWDWCQSMHALNIVL